MTTTTMQPTRQKSVGLAYVLLILFSGFGIHRFYLGRPWTGLMMMAITISGFFTGFTFIISLIWVIVDLFLIPRMARGQ